MISILILAHQKKEDFYSYWNKVSKKYNVNIYIHLDKKQNIKITSLQSSFPNLNFYSKYNVYWAHESMIDSTVFLLDKALENKCNTHFYLLSLDSIILQDVRTFNHFTYKFHNYVICDYDKFYKKRSHKFYFFKKSDYSRKFVFRLMDKILTLCQSNSRKTFFDGSFKGDQWVLLDRDNAVLSCNIYNKHSVDLNYTNCSDEFFFQNIISSSLFISSQEQCLIYTNWSEKNSPDILSHDMLLKAKNDGYLFARKVDHCLY